MKLDQLVHLIEQTHSKTFEFALQQVNYSLTIRNWLIGLYIVEFEQIGEEKAAYGSNLLSILSKELIERGLKGLNDRSLRTCRLFYNSYPQIWRTLSAKFQNTENQENIIWQTVSAKFTAQNNPIGVGSQLEEVLKKPSEETTAQPENGQPASETFSFPPDVLLSKLSFSHFIELLKADSSLKRAFYEVQSIKNNWSVRELKRAMETLLFERTGMSQGKASVIAKIKDEVIPSPKDLIKNPYILEFLQLEEKPEFSESDLEQSIIEHLQHFLIEMGRGFCFEARQKRITFDNEHYFIDLVFYHRILKCHVLVDLKIGSFSHADAGQMNLYLNYFKDQEMTAGDNPPVGIILCAGKNDALVKYATGGLAQEVFVGKYLVQLPSEEELKQLLETDTKVFRERQEVYYKMPKGYRKYTSS